MAETLKITFTKERETKGTVVFAEEHPDTEAPIVRTLYVAKHAHAKLGGADKLTVTIEAAE